MGDNTVKKNKHDLPLENEFSLGKPIPQGKGFSLEKTIESIGHRDIALEAIRMFFTLGESEYLHPMQKSIDEKDCDTIFNTAHKLSGVAARLKIDEILVPVKKIVQASRNKKEIDYLKCYLEIENAFNMLKAKCAL